MPGLKPLFRNSLSAEGAKAVTIKAWVPKARMLMPNSGRFVRLCVRLTFLNLLKVYMNLFLRFFCFEFLKFFNWLCIYRSNGLWSGATPISDGIFLFSCIELRLIIGHNLHHSSKALRSRTQYDIVVKPSLIKRMQICKSTSFFSPPQTWWDLSRVEDKLDSDSIW